LNNIEQLEIRAEADAKNKNNKYGMFRQMPNILSSLSNIKTHYNKFLCQFPGKIAQNFSSRNATGEFFSLYCCICNFAIITSL